MNIEIKTIIKIHERVKADVTIHHADGEPLKCHAVINSTKANFRKDITTTILTGWVHGGEGRVDVVMPRSCQRYGSKRDKERTYFSAGRAVVCLRRGRCLYFPDIVGDWM